MFKSPRKGDVLKTLHLKQYIYPPPLLLLFALYTVIRKKSDHILLVFINHLITDFIFKDCIASNDLMGEDSRYDSLAFMMIYNSSGLLFV